MPNITITEQNLNSSITTIGTDIPYIPGFRGQDYDSTTTVDSKYPELFTNLAIFQKKIGKKPFQFTAEQKDQAETPITILNANDFDKSYLMAVELLRQGMPVYYHVIDTTVDASSGNTMIDFYRDLHTYLTSDDLLDKGEYTIKYLTSGGYPNTGITVNNVSDGSAISIAKDLTDIAKDRGDCVAICEYINDASADLSSWYTTAISTDIQSEYATIFYPWSNHELSSKYDGTTFYFDMPASYSYLISLAKSIKTNPNWLAIAGVGRGYVSSIKTLNLTSRLSNTIADNYQPTEGDNKFAINAITNIKPYGFSIWGNRTLKKIEAGKKLDATYFLNTRNMISDIKKVCYSAAKALMFEQNSDLLWLDFKGRITPFLERLSAGKGISGYSIIKLTSDKRNELKCQLRIYPISAVESFDIAIQITDSDVSVQ